MAQTDRTTDRQTDGHGDSMTNSAQWGRVGEKYIDIDKFYFCKFYKGTSKNKQKSKKIIWTPTT